MSRSRNFLSILIPSATVFFSSACIMVLELVAGRLIARHLGSSLYTWTSVIGVVLAGITIGNYLGGRIADRFPARKALAVLFALSSVACVIIVILNNIVGEWIWLWRFSWPARTFTHVSLVFLLPSTLLGTISPVVAKMALDRGLATGRTVGDIYAWGAAGSIAGTFLAGFYLIATLGTVAIIWTVGAALLLLAILYWAKLWVLYLWAVIFIVALTMGMAPAEWAESTGSSIRLRERPNPDIIYEDESQYCYIAVRQNRNNPNKRAFYQDKLMHSKIIIGDINNLQYFHTIIFAAITNGLSQDKENLSVMHIGGGGYVFPQYIEANWLGSRNDVAEIDPRVTRAAMEAFGLRRDTTINTIPMDARNYVDELLEKERNGQQIPQYDFIYEDAFSDYSVPFQLVTKEFHDKIAQILTDDGVYMVNLIDIFDFGLFLGSVVNTLIETFPYVYVTAEELALSSLTSSSRVTFVVVASKRELDLPDIISGYKQKKLKLWYLSESDIEQLREKSKGLVITDDYAPVENLLAGVVLVSAKDIMASKYLSRGYDLKRQKQFSESIAFFQAAIKADKLISVKTYNEIGLLYSAMDQLEKAAEAFSQAIESNKQTGNLSKVGSIHFNLGIVLQKMNKPRQAHTQFLTAIEEFKKELVEAPEYKVETYRRLGDTYATIGDFKNASEVFIKALALNPSNPVNYTNLEKALEYQGRYEEAIEVLRQQIRFFENHISPEDIKQIQENIEFLEYKKSRQKK